MGHLEARRRSRRSTAARCRSTCCSSRGFVVHAVRGAARRRAVGGLRDGVDDDAVGVELTCYYYSFLFAMTLLYSKRKEAGAIMLGVTAADRLHRLGAHEVPARPGLWAEPQDVAVARRAVHVDVGGHVGRLRLDHVPVRDEPLEATEAGRRAANARAVEGGSRRGSRNGGGQQPPATLAAPRRRRGARLPRLQAAGPRFGGRLVAPRRKRGVRLLLFRLTPRAGDVARGAASRSALHGEPSGQK